MAKKAKKPVEGLQKFNRVKPATNVAITALFIFLALLCFMPALLVLIVSFSSEKSVVTIGYSYFPLEWSLASYTYLFNQGAYIGKAFINSIFVTITGTALGLDVLNHGLRAQPSQLPSAQVLQLFHPDPHAL